jgi:bifunctional enzyme CysN/CysC
MDLVGYSRQAFEEIVAEYTAFSEKLEIHDITFIPVSALHGDNVVDKSSNMPWYEGSTVMRHLETVVISPDRNLIDFRYPVQYVIQIPGNGRGYAGRILSGTIKTGENIIVLPSGVSSSVETIYTDDEETAAAEEGQSVVISLSDEIDVSRGDMIVRKNNVPVIDNKMEAILCWMDEKNELSVRGHYLLRHSTRETRAFIRDLRYRIDVNTLHRETAQSLHLNEIGRVEIETTAPLFFDPYHVNRGNGSFILIDPVSNNTVAAGMIRSEGRDSSGYEKAKTSHSPNVRWERHEIGKKEREKRQDHTAHVLWFTGLSGSGKSSLCRELEQILFKEGKQVYILDGDNIRHGLNGDLGFSAEDRKENIRRIGHVAKLFYDAGFIVMCAFISPASEMRQYVRELFPSGGFSEIYIKCDIEECKRRDPKGLYDKALKGEISEFTGISAPYEEPKEPELVIDTASSAIHESIGALLSYLEPLLQLDTNSGRGTA